MQQFVFKEQIREAIAGRKVTAALFYTFNFDPRFFENYLMPLFVPEKTFRDEAIYNKILWRHCQKEGLIPPITVYCDFFAKDNTTAPSLGYQIHCVRTPAAPGYTCNFHPKHIFLLLQQGNEQSLLLITGSGNITVSGWCENFEGISIQEFPKNNSRPKMVQTNHLQDIIRENAGLRSFTSALSEAEEAICNFLRYVDFDSKQYFSSLKQSFKTFLEEQVFHNDKISEIEIISPYFSDDTSLLCYLQKQAPIVKCLVPLTRQYEIQLAKHTFLKLQENGLVWCEWELYREHNRNNEVRNLHAKIYRLQGKNRTYTIIGSVNFTNPAWKKYSSSRNEANIEAAWLYIENRQSPLLKPKQINTDAYRFIDKENQDQAAGAFAERNIPEIDFVLNWKLETLKIQVRSQAKDFFFYNISKDTPVTKGNSQVRLSSNDIKKLTRNTLIEIVHKAADGATTVFCYYIQQEDIAAKPLDFHLDAIQILKYWALLGDEYAQESAIQAIAESATDESGIVEENRLPGKTLLNEMAAHFNGLIKLEQHIFNQSAKNIPRIVHYYLLSENIDTLPYYLKDLKAQLTDKKILQSFYWMILQIIQTNFYDHALKKVKTLRSDEYQSLMKELRDRKKILNKTTDQVAEEIKMTDGQKHWIMKQLSEKYA